MDIAALKNKFPQLAALAAGKELIWFNAHKNNTVDVPVSPHGFSPEDIVDAEKRLKRFAPFIAKAFPETEKTGGIIESPLTPIPEMQQMLGLASGRLFLKQDSHLPVSGSIKARGGIYEVLKFAEKIATDAGMLKPDEDYAKLLEPAFVKLFSGYSVAVGSTGNLGLSIGIISARLGFRVTVHMSADARQWKKDLLRTKGVEVIEYPEDYQKAVAEGRKIAEKDPNCHFVDDENSADLFLGYAVAGRRLGAQFAENEILCDAEHPVILYIPCGVGGAPGGVAFGMRTVFGKNLHVFFAEPTHAPCMTLSMITGLGNRIAVSDVGLDGKTAADGLAVGRASALVSAEMKEILDGCFTVEDEALYPYLTQLADHEGIFIEPSACASFPGPALVTAAKEYLASCGMEDSIRRAAHILWATGGSMVPKEEMKSYYLKGRE